MLQRTKTRKGVLCHQAIDGSVEKRCQNWSNGAGATGELLIIQTLVQASTTLESCVRVTTM